MQLYEFHARRRGNFTIYGKNGMVASEISVGSKIYDTIYA